MPKTNEIRIEQIVEFPLFSKLSATELQALIPMFEIQRMNPGDTVFAEWEDGDSMYLILQGSIDIRKCIDKELHTNKSLATLPKGEFFGEMSLLTGESRSASAVVLEHATLLKIPREQFISLMSREPKIASQLLGGLVSMISKRLRATSLESVTLYETGRILSITSNVTELSTKILDRLLKSTDAEAGLILFWNEIVECFEIQVMSGFSQNDGQTTVFHGSCGFSQFLLGLTEPITIESGQLHQELQDSGLCLPGVVYVPLLTDYSDPNAGYQCVKCVTGAIVLCHSNSQHFSLANMTLLKGVAQQVAQALLNAKYLQENESRRAYEQVFVTPGF